MTRLYKTNSYKLNKTQDIIWNSSTRAPVWAGLSARIYCTCGGETSNVSSLNRIYFSSAGSVTSEGLGIGIACLLPGSVWN